MSTPLRQRAQCYLYPVADCLDDADLSGCAGCWSWSCEAHLVRIDGDNYCLDCCEKAIVAIFRPVNKPLPGALINRQIERSDGTLMVSR